MCKLFFLFLRFSTENLKNKIKCWNTFFQWKCSIFINWNALIEIQHKQTTICNKKFFLYNINFHVNKCFLFILWIHANKNYLKNTKNSGYSTNFRLREILISLFITINFSSANSWGGIATLRWMTTKFDNCEFRFFISRLFFQHSELL